MNSELAVAAAITCAICNAVAAVLQKFSSDKVEKIQSFDLNSAKRLLAQWPYTTGVVLDMIAGLLTLVAVHKLPLFMVQAIVASGVVLTALCERVFLKRKLSKRIYVASIVVVIGLSCLALASHSEQTASTTFLVRLSLLILPILIALVGIVAIKQHNKPSALILAILSGIAFGCVAIIGRILVYPTPIWLTLKNPLLWAMTAFGVFGLYLFTAALQRTLATIANGVMLSAQTIVPLLIGILLLGDTARNGLWILVWAGCALVTCGCVYIAFND